MTMALVELDVAFLASTGAPMWQPLGSHDFAMQNGTSRLGAANADWSEVARQIEQDLRWGEVVALLEGERRADLRG